MKKQIDLKKAAVTAMLCALAYICMFVLRIKVSFLTFDAKDAVIAIASLLFGPAYGVVSAAVVAVLEFLTVSDTGVYGLIMNFLSSGTFALTTGLIYRYRRTFGGAILAMGMSVVSVTVVMVLANLFVTPAFMGVDRSVVIGMLPSLLLPFNLAKASMNAGITLAIYKPLTVSLRKTGLLPQSGEGQYGFNARSAMLILISVLVVILAVVVLVLGLEGSFEFIRK